MQDHKEWLTGCVSKANTQVPRRTPSTVWNSRCIIHKKYTNVLTTIVVSHLQGPHSRRKQFHVCRPLW
uniref:Uncharacterized protein n=1 Tax=Arion vulgaris TaxID=1028688 RepID=A0A0B7AB40_9EUPU